MKRVARFGVTGICIGLILVFIFCGSNIVRVKAISSNIGNDEQNSNNNSSVEKWSSEWWGNFFGFEENDYVSYLTLVDGVPQNYYLFEEWLDKYRKGEPSYVNLILFGHPATYSLQIKNGNTENITVVVASAAGHVTEGKFSFILDREYDYIFGDDTQTYSFPIDKKKVVTYEPPTRIYKKDIDSANLLDTQAAVHLFEQVMKDSGGLEYNITCKIDDDLMYTFADRYFYSIKMHTIIDGEEKWVGSEYAISADDGQIILQLSLVSAEMWYLYHDANAKKIMPSVNPNTGRG